MVKYNPLIIGQRVVHEYVHHGIKQERAGVFIGFVQHRRTYKGEQQVKVKFCETACKEGYSKLPVSEIRDINIGVL